MVEQRPGLDGLVGGPHLAEDLALARHERVEPGGDPEEMQRGGVLVQAVDDSVQWLAGDLLERREHLALADPVDVELGAVAGRKADGVAERPRERRRGAEVERHPLAQLDRRDVVREADEGQTSSEVAPCEREARDDHEREAAEREVGSAAPRRAKREEAAVDEPRARP